ncbi:MAG: ribosome small subunit-dependent GTPase A [Saccharofermentans sp.]|nr:ribosome small subunit-dependent GTPase A [Saccharofermentans sp.]
MPEDPMQGIITKGVGGTYTVRAGGIRHLCQVRGKFRGKGISPQSGDKVIIEPSGDPDLPYVITQILPRKNFLMRPPVANVDYLLLTFAASDPEPDLMLLDKLLILCGNWDITPIIIFTKEDLGTDAASKLYKTYTDAGFKVFVSSADSPVKSEDILAITGDGIAAFAGPSGVGKSTLCNSILGINIMDVGEISDKLKRGKHTTRHVELFDFGEGFLTDTPGFTSLMLDQAGIEYRQVILGYPEIEKFASGCRFDNCRHVAEAGCVVRQKLSEGLIDSERYTRYCSFSEQLYSERNNYKRRKSSE